MIPKNLHPHASRSPRHIPIHRALSALLIAVLVSGFFLPAELQAQGQKKRGFFDIFRKREEVPQPPPPPPRQPYTPPPIAPPPKPVVRAEAIEPDAPGVPSPLSQNPMPAVRPEVIVPEGTTDPVAPEKPLPLPPSPQPLTAGALASDQLEYANMLFSYKHYDLALRQYGQFLADHPRHPGTEIAWYRLGECYLKQGDLLKAEECYRNQLRFFPRGQYLAAGAFRLASLAYNARDFRTAATNFLIADTSTSEREIKLTARYHYARCLQETGRTADAAEALRALAVDKEDNPYNEAAILQLARMAASSHRNDVALDGFETLIVQGANPDIIAEAYFKAGLIHDENGEHGKAAEYFSKALESRKGDYWKPLAYYALLKSYYEAGEYDKVVQTYTSDAQNLPEESRASLLLLVGNSYRRAEKFTDAIETYNLIEQRHGNSREGQEAGYRKLLCFYDASDPSLFDYIDKYVESHQYVNPDLPYIDMALMLKAENQFSKGEYPEAAATYAKVRPENIDVKLRPSRLYKLGWAFSESGNSSAAIDSLTQFLTLQPDDSKVSSALAQRAASYKQLGDHGAFLSDLRRITEEFPDSAAAEYAHQQLALTYGRDRQFPEMVAAFQNLLKFFPETKGAAEANYWIGYGEFEQKRFHEAIAALTKARELDKENYHERGSLRIILAYYYLQDLPGTIKETDAFIDSKPETAIPNQVLSWLGVSLFDDEDYEPAEKFLSLASNPEDPEQTKNEIWQALGKARLEIKKFPEAVAAFDFYLASISKPSVRARALLDKSFAQLGMQDYSGAGESATEALALEKQGRVNALIRMQIGDIALAQNKFDDAAREYIVISQIFLDPEITPRAMHKAAEALEKAGNQEKAESIRADLRKAFPDFKVANP